jgi:hypothetical protein
MTTQPQPSEHVATTDQHEEKIVTTLKNGKLVAHIFGHEQLVDSISAVAAEAKTAAKTWEEQKPTIRSMARRIIDSIENKAIAVRAVLFQGTAQNVVEVCPSDKKKVLSQDLVNEAKFRNAEHVLQQTVDVVLTGPLALWAISNLPILTKSNVLEEHMTINNKIVLTDTFKELYKKVMQDPETSTDYKAFYQRLFEGGYNLPAVEAKR